MIMSGDNLVMKVDVVIYLCKKIECFGVVLFISMYMIGENDWRVGWDWCLEIYDFDGLFINIGVGEWIWWLLINLE